MKTLILSCNTGQGHNSCAGAIREAYARKGLCCEAVDAMAFISPHFSRFLSWGHTTLYRELPRLSRWGYDYMEKHSDLFSPGTGRLLSGGTARLRQYILDGHYDAVICTHVFSALLVTAMLQERPMRLKTAFVATDHTCSPGVDQSRLDRYFVPDGAVKQVFVDAGIPAEKLTVSGIPIRSVFYQARDKAAAKRQMGMDPDKPHLLMACGSMGCGPMLQMAKQLAGPEHQVSIVCGTNEKLRRTLEKQWQANANVRVLGYAQDMAGLMDSADLYLTKPGGLSVTEAAAKRLPMVLVDAVAGCEEYNRRHFVRQGGAGTGDSAEAVTGLCLQLLRDEPRRREMAQALARHPAADAAQVICSTMTGGAVQ